MQTPPKRNAPGHGRKPAQESLPRTYASALRSGIPDGPGAARALVLHEEISTDPPPKGPLVDTRTGCPRWPERMWLRNVATGELVQGRCNSANMCDYCAKLNAVLNSEALALDALESGNAPRVWLVLTTPRPAIALAAFYKPFQLLMRAIRAEFPGAEYAALLEFTTGYGRLSGGERRPHWNVLLKNVPDDPAALERVSELVARHWCVPATGARLRVPDRRGGWKYLQHVGSVEDAAGLMRYIALHFQKESQAPPRGFRGHRFRKSRGYFSEPMPIVRAHARRSLSIKRYIWRGLDSSQAELCADAAALERWALTLQGSRGRAVAERDSVPPTLATVRD